MAAMRPIFCTVVLCILVQLLASVVVSRLQAVFPIFPSDVQAAAAPRTPSPTWQDLFVPFISLLYCQVVSCFIIAPYITTFWKVPHLR